MLPTFLLDWGIGNFGLQANTAIELETEGDIALEGNVSFNYSFVLDKKSRTIISPLVEFAIENPIKSDETETIVNIIPGIKLASGGWHLGIGVELPMTQAKEFDYQGMVQFGYHIKWDNLLQEAP